MYAVTEEEQQSQPEVLGTNSIRLGLDSLAATCDGPCAEDDGEALPSWSVDCLTIPTDRDGILAKLDDEFGPSGVVFVLDHSRRTSAGVWPTANSATTLVPT